MKPRWKTYLFSASLIIVGGGLVFLVVETIQAKNTGFETKTLWDWMELLIIPLVLAIGAFYLNRSERAVERQIAETRVKEDRQLAEDRAMLEREIATDRQQEAALQVYLDRMGELLLKEKLRTTQNEEVRDVARIRTLAVLRGLDAIRKGLVIKFLHEAKLISTPKPQINLDSANLESVYLHNINLQDVNLERAILKSANLQYAGLEGANLQNADLQFADLSQAELMGTRLLYARMQGVILRNADLRYSDLSGANLEGADLQGAVLRDAQLIGANLRGANLAGAFLQGASLQGAILTDTDLYEANLEMVILPDGTMHD